VGTTNGDNLGGSSYLYLFKLKVLHLLDLYDISLRIENIFIFVDGSHFISYFLLKYMPTIHKYHSSLTGLPYRSMDGDSFIELII
jgi:hypothetical protein